MTRRPGAPFSIALKLMVLLAGSGGPLEAGFFIDLGPSDGLALDQPRVAIEVIVEEGAETPRSLGPEFSNTLLVDTAANSIVLVGSAVSELNTAGYQTVAVYDEQGIAGVAPMNVSVPYRLDFAGETGIRQTLSGVRMLSNASLNFGSFNGLLGMPALLGRTMSMDMTVWSEPFPSFLGVDFAEAPPAGAGHRYSVPLTLVEFPPSGRREPTDPLPVWAPLAAAEVELGFGPARQTQRLLLDTGAQISFISSEIAFALGLDEDSSGSFLEEAIDLIPVGGIGGEIDVPILLIDSLAMPTDEGVELVWTDAPIGILDIDPSVAGVIGMEILTSGWLEKFLLGTGDDGYVFQAHVDLRDAENGKGWLLLDLNPANDLVEFTALLGDMDLDDDVDYDDISPLVLGLNDPLAYQSTYGLAPAVNGDLDGSGALDYDDIAPFVVLLGGSAIVASSQAVPEPATAQLAASAGLGFVLLSALRAGSSIRPGALRRPGSCGRA
jgi:hypothetical protein